MMYPSYVLDTDFYLYDRAGCSSNVGMICWPGGQHLNLAKGCWTKGVVIHELGKKKIITLKLLKLKGKAIISQ